MSQFDRPADDYTFDLEAEEFSLESILDEYKDYDPSKPEPAPQPRSGFAARPVDAALIDEDAGDESRDEASYETETYDEESFETGTYDEESFETETYDEASYGDETCGEESYETGAREDEVPGEESEFDGDWMEAPSPGAGDAPEDDEDADVREYRPARDHFTDEERQKWNEAKDTARQFAKKGFNGLKHWVGKMTAQSGEADEPFEEESAIPVSEPPVVPEGLYPDEPEPASEPTLIFRAVSDDTETTGFADGEGAQYAAPEAGGEDAEFAGEGAHRSFRESVVNPVVSAMAVVAFRIRQHRTEVRASAAEEEDPGPEPDAETASKYYGGQIHALRFRCRAAMLVSLVLAYISFGLPVFGLLDSSPAAAALVCLILQLTVMMIGLDVVTSGILSLVRRQPGLEALVVVNCVFSILDAVVTAVRGAGDTGLPFCAVSAFAVACCIWSALLTCRGYKMTFRALAAAKDPVAVSADSDVVRDGIAILKSRRDTAGFIHRSEESGPAEAIYSVITPYLLAVSLVLGLLAAVLSKRYAEIAHILAAVTAPCAPFAAIVAFALPYRTVARRLCRNGSAIAGWSGVSDIGKSRHLIVTDRDIFPPRNISIESIRILDGALPDKVISYASSVVIASGSCLAPIFSELMRKNNCALMPVEEFTCNESGGLIALVNGEEVLVGNSGFMSLKGIHLPQGLNSKSAVFVSINGVFVAIFKIQYVAVTSVQAALSGLLRSSLEPVFAVRDFNITPLMLRQKFKMSTDGFDFPAYSRRYAMSAAEPGEYTQIAGIVSRDGLGPFVSVSSLGKRLYRTVQICVFLALLWAVLGMVTMFVLCAMGAFDSATVGNLLMYLLLSLFPVILLNFGLRR